MPNKLVPIFISIGLAVCLVTLTMLFGVWLIEFILSGGIMAGFIVVIGIIIAAAFAQYLYPLVKEDIDS